MQKTATLNLRVDPAVKSSADAIFSALGLSMSTAVDMFLRQVVYTGGIPFALNVPEAARSVDVAQMSNAELRETFSRGMKEISAGKGIEAHDAFEAFRAENSA